jgi:hypothetical protein
MKLAPILAASSLIGLVACASKTEAPEQDTGLEGEGVAGAASAPDVNPEGIPYPSDNIGTIERKGKTPGNRIKNFKFMGYRNGDTSKGLEPLSLAEFYDPNGTSPYRILHIQATGVWCTYCRAETEIVVPLKAELEKRKVAWLVSVAEGPTMGTPSKQKDLDGWIAEFKSPYTHVLDPNNANLGPFYDRTALPWNANIDTRTMEILSSGTGGSRNAEELLKKLDEAIELAATSTLDRK